MFDLPSPDKIITGIADDRQKRAVIGNSVGLVYSVWITFLYSFGDVLSQRRMIGWLGYPFMLCAAVMFKMLLLQHRMKLIDLAVPEKLSKNKPLLDSVYWVEEKQ